MTIAELWTEFTIMFPSQMRMYGPHDGALARGWQKELRHSEIEVGVANLKNSGASFLPSLPEFKKLCTRHPQEKSREGDTEADRIAAQKLVAGMHSSKTNRIVIRGDEYVHQIKKNDGWIDARWQEAYNAKIANEIPRGEVHKALVKAITGKQSYRSRRGNNRDQ